jgi:diacylglycerol kinase (ATP)
MKKNGSFAKRLGYATQGIGIVFRREKSFRTHLVLAACAILIAALLQVSPIWWALVALCIGLVLALEALNGALEYVIDRLHPELHEEIRCAKDAAAGAVLLASIATAVVGALMVLDWWRGS